MEKLVYHYLRLSLFPQYLLFDIHLNTIPEQQSPHVVGRQESIVIAIDVLLILRNFYHNATSICVGISSNNDINVVESLPRCKLRILTAIPLSSAVGCPADDATKPATIASGDPNLQDEVGTAQTQADAASDTSTAVEAPEATPAPPPAERASPRATMATFLEAVNQREWQRAIDTLHMRREGYTRDVVTARRSMDRS